MLHLCLARRYGFSESLLSGPVCLDRVDDVGSVFDCVVETLATLYPKVIS